MCLSFKCSFIEILVWFRRRCAYKVTPCKKYICKMFVELCIINFFPLCKVSLKSSLEGYVLTSNGDRQTDRQTDEVISYTKPPTSILPVSYDILTSPKKLPRGKYIVWYFDPGVRISNDIMTPGVMIFRPLWNIDLPN